MHVVLGDFLRVAFGLETKCSYVNAVLTLIPVESRLIICVLCAPGLNPTKQSSTEERFTKQTAKQLRLFRATC